MYMNPLSGVGIDGPNDEGIILVKKKGKVQMLKDEIYAQEKTLQFEKVIRFNKKYYEISAGLTILSFK